MIGVFCQSDGIRLRQDLPDPAPNHDEVVVNVQLVGICETDLQLARGYLGFQGVPGHEFVAQMPNGKRVTAEINNACETCPTCLAGRSHHCPRRTVLGIVGHDGAMAERVAVPRRNLHFLPDRLSDSEAVFIEPLAAALRIGEQFPIGPGAQAVVVGDGKLGLLCVWVLREAGAAVTWVGKHPAKLALAGDGIQPTLLADAPTLGRIFDYVVDATGSPSGLSTALRLVRPMGAIILKTTVAGRYEIDLAPIVIDEIRLVGSRCGPFDRAIAALIERRFDVTKLIEAEYPLIQSEAAFAAAARPGARKVLIRVAPR